MSAEQVAAIQQHLNDMSEAQLAVLKAIYEESQRLVPVDTGNLKESGEYDSTSVGYGADYAAHVEFGTVKMEAQPFLRPAAENHKDELAHISANVIQKEIKAAV